MRADVYFQKVGDNASAELAIDINPDTTEERAVLQSMKSFPFSSVLVQDVNGPKLRLYSVALSRMSEWEDAA
jgi:hypothetical protein